MNSVEDVAKLLEEFVEREESQKYLAIMLGRTGFGSKMQVGKSEAKETGEQRDCVYFMKTLKLLMMLRGSMKR